MLQVILSSGYDSCQEAQHGQELFWAIKECPNLRRELGSFGNNLLIAQLVILSLGPGMVVCFVSKAMIPLGAVDREVLFVQRRLQLQLK